MSINVHLRLLEVAVVIVIDVIVLVNIIVLDLLVLLGHIVFCCVIYLVSMCGWLGWSAVRGVAVCKVIFVSTQATVKVGLGLAYCA